MAKEWCVQGLTLKFTIAGTPVTGGEATISSVPSSTVKVNGKGVYAGTFNVSFAGCTYGSYTQAAPAVFAISCGAQYSKADNKAIMLKEDNGTAKGVSFVMGQSSTTFDIKCEVSDAGQDKVKEL